MNEIKEKLDTIAQIGELVQLKLISETDGRIIINTLTEDVMIKFLTTDVKKSLEIKPREDFETKDIDKPLVVTKIDKSFIEDELGGNIANGIKDIPPCKTLEEIETNISNVFVNVFGKEINLQKESANMLLINAISSAIWEREQKYNNSL